MPGERGKQRWDGTPPDCCLLTTNAVVARVLTDASGCYKLWALVDPEKKDGTMTPTTSEIIAHDQINGELYVRLDDANGFPRDLGFEGEDVSVEIQHAPCCRGEIALGVRHDSQHMDVVGVYLSPEAAVVAAQALLAAAAHAQGVADFGDTSGDTTESWRASHERAAAWVRETILR